MEKDMHNIEDLFRSALDDNEEMPSAKVWDVVDNRLDKETVTAIKKKYEKLKKLSLLLLLLLIGFVIYELSNRHTNDDLAKTNNGSINKETVSDEDNSRASNGDTGTLKEQNDPKDVKRRNGVIRITDNSVTDKNNKATDQPVLQGKSSGNHKQIKKNIPGRASDASNDVIVIETEPALISKPGMKKIKTSPSKENKPEVAASNNNSEINQQQNSLLQLNLTSAEKINRLTANLYRAEKISRPIISNRAIPSIGTKTSTPQQSRKKETKPSRFSVIGFFSPDLVSYRLEDEDTPGQPDNADLIRKTERHEFSSTSGAWVDYKMNDRWTLESGLTFSNTNIAIEPKTIYAQPDNNGDIKFRLNVSSGYGYLHPSFQPSPAVGDSLRVTAATHKLRYLGIPIAVKYTIIKGKLKIETMSGVTANFLTMGKLETEIQKGLNNEIDILNNIQSLKSIYVSGLAGIGAEYKLTGRFSFILMPTARFALIPINKGSVVKSYPNSFGIAAGLKIRL